VEEDGIIKVGPALD